MAHSFTSHFLFPDLRMRKTLFSLCTLGALVTAVPAQAQQAVPVRELSEVDAKSSGHFGAIFNLRQLPNGKVLINDAVRRQVVMLDDKLSNPIVVIDSVSEGSNSYGPRAAPLIPYLSDSTLFVDGTSLSLLVIDPFGKVAHVMSAPKPQDLRFLAGGASGVDGQGNLVYRGAMVVQAGRGAGPAPAGGNAAPIMAQPPDSAPILRANFDTRAVDTVGRVKIQSGTRVSVTPGADGKMQMKMTVNPLMTVDDWAVLSDGSIAFVRGHDYHIDWIRPDGSTMTSAKLPFDWKRLTDDDKQKLIDSARTDAEKRAADARANPGRGGAELVERMAATAGMGGAVAAGGGGGMQVMVRVDGAAMGGGGGTFTAAPGGPGGPGGFQMGTPVVEYVPLNEIDRDAGRPRPAHPGEFRCRALAARARRRPRALQRGVGHRRMRPARGARGGRAGGVRRAH